MEGVILINHKKTAASLCSPPPEEAPEVAAVAASLGKLPPKVRYFDEYEEVTRSLDPEADVWRITANGRTVRLDFSLIRPKAASILDRKSTRLNFSHLCASRMPSSA